MEERMFRSVGLVCLLLGVAAQAAEIPERPAAPQPAMAVAVNCNNGGSIQAAVNANPGPGEIQITGICVENVLIRDKDVSLRGTQKPSLDGIRSVVRSMPAGHASPADCASFPHFSEVDAPVGRRRRVSFSIPRPHISRACFSPMTRF
jgi:hypothetical protein